MREAATIRLSQVRLEALEPYPLANLFPMAGDEELAGMAADMATHGFRATRPILLLDGQILDGRNRRQACLMAAQQGRYRTAWAQKFNSNAADALRFVLSENPLYSPIKPHH